MLRSRAIRRMLNVAYERLGPRFDDRFNQLFDDSKVPCDFVWKCHFCNKEFALPVFPDLQRSWNNARAWGWSGNRSIRAFYEFYIRNCTSGTFLDIGANDGTHAFPFAAHGYMCVCFEPEPTCVDYIDRVCKLNSYSNVTIVKCVLSNEDVNDVDFYSSDSTWFSSLTKAWVERFEPSCLMKVGSMKLDSYCYQHQVKPTLIKIDVEGWEWPVIQGGRRVFEQFRPDVLVEVFPGSSGKRGIWDFFRRLDYRFYVVQHNTQQPFSSVRSLREFLAARESNFILLGEPWLVSSFENFYDRV